MAVSFALPTPADYEVVDDAPLKGFGKFAGGLLNRVKKAGSNLREAGQKLRNMSRTDALYLSLSIGAGLGAKTAAVSGLAAIGIATGGTGLLAIGAGLGIAAVGGASVGLAKSLVKQIRNVREGKETNFFSRETLKNTASTMAISAATFGASELFEYTSGQTFGSFLSNAFNKVTDAVSDKVVALVSGTGVFQAAKEEALRSENFASGLIRQPGATTDYVPFKDAAPAAAPASAPTAVAQAAAPAAAPQASTAATHQPARPSAAHQPSRPSAQHTTAAPKVAVNAALIAAQEAAQETARDEFALNRLRELILNTTGVAAPDTATAQDLAKQFHSNNPEGFLNGLRQQAPILPAAQPSAPAAAPSTRGIAPASAAAPAAPQAPAAPAAAKPTLGKDSVSTPLVADNEPEQAIAKLKTVLTQDDLTNHYTLERLQLMVKDTTGLDAPAGATAEDLAKQLKPDGADAFLKGIQQQAPQLKVENLAASCKAEIPKERSVVTVINTLCTKFKETMTGSSIVFVENTNAAEPTNAYRLLFRKAVSALTGAPATESTNTFISENVSGANGVVREMTEAALAP